jgi:hypothetical protein
VRLRHESFRSGFEEQGALASCTELFADRAAADFLGLHQSGGVRWFNQERFELLLAWLLWLSPFAVGGMSQPQAALQESYALLVESAAAAGYRLDGLLKRLEKPVAP